MYDTRTCLLKFKWNNASSLIIQYLVQALSDSGASSTVWRKIWFQAYLKSFPTGKPSIRYTSSSKLFWFGNRKQLESEQMATIPATIGQHKTNIKTGIINSDIRLLLPKSAMKKAQIQINFDKDTLEFLGEVSLNTNSSYCLQITSPRQLTTKFSTNSCEHHITLRVTDS